MSPKDKAKELVDKIYNSLIKGYSDNDIAQILAHKLWYSEAKDSAIICVDEIISLGFIFYGDPNKENNPEYWQLVKKEINAL